MNDLQIFIFRNMSIFKIPFKYLLIPFKIPFFKGIKVFFIPFKRYNCTLVTMVALELGRKLINL